MHLFFNRSVLPIGTHLLLPMAPEVIHAFRSGHRTGSHTSPIPRIRAMRRDILAI